MSLERLVNRASTNLALSATDAVTAISVNSFSGFPTQSDYRILIDNELMLVTGGAGTTTWTVTRGIEGTIAAAHSAGARISQVLTAAGLQKYIQETYQTGTAIFGTASGTGTALTMTLSPAPTSPLTNGTVINFKSSVSNSGACTLNVNSTGAASIVKDAGVALEAGDITASNWNTVIWDGTNFNLISRSYKAIKGPTSSTDRAIPYFNGTTGNNLSNQSIWSLPSNGSLKMTASQFSAGTYFLYNTTTNSTETELFLDGSSTRLSIPSSSAWTFKISIVAHAQGDSLESAGWVAQGVIHNNSGTTAIVGASPSAIVGSFINLGDTVQGAWLVRILADDSNDALTIKVTGQASKNIRWVAKVETVELTY